LIEFSDPSHFLQTYNRQALGNRTLAAQFHTATFPLPKPFNAVVMSCQSGRSVVRSIGARCRYRVISCPASSLTTWIFSLGISDAMSRLGKRSATTIAFISPFFLAAKFTPFAPRAPMAPTCRNHSDGSGSARTRSDNVWTFVQHFQRDWCLAQLNSWKTGLVIKRLVT
jgi:hypothetical protein